MVYVQMPPAFVNVETGLYFVYTTTARFCVLCVYDNLKSESVGDIIELEESSTLWTIFCFTVVLQLHVYTSLKLCKTSRTRHKKGKQHIKSRIL